MRTAVGHTLRLLFGGALFTVTFLFAAGYLSAYLPPGRFWWTGLAASLLPYLSVAVLVAGLGGWLIFRSRWFLGFVACSFLLIVVRMAPLFSTSANAAEDDDLVFMTFNTKEGRSTEAMRRATLELVREERPDLLALQESAVGTDASGNRRVSPRLRVLLDSTSYAAPEADRLEQPVIATIPIESHRQITLEAGTGSSEPSYATRVQFQWQGRSAVLYNLHLHSIGPVRPWQDSSGIWQLSYWRGFLRAYRQAYRRRVWEARQLREMLDDETLPLIVAGDLNSTPYHWEHRHLSQGLQDAFQRGGTGLGRTYPSHRPLVHIDHVLVSPEWRVKSAHVSEAETYSDHRPVVVRLQWQSSDSS